MAIYRALGVSVNEKGVSIQEKMHFQKAHSQN